LLLVTRFIDSFNCQAILLIPCRYQNVSLGLGRRAYAHSLLGFLLPVHVAQRKRCFSVRLQGVLVTRCGTIPLTPVTLDACLGSWPPEQGPADHCFPRCLYLD